MSAGVCDKHGAYSGPMCPSCAEAITKELIPWNEKTGPGRVRPRECVANARDALNAAYGYDRATLPLLIEAVDWLRRALEQMVPPEDEAT